MGGFYGGFVPSYSANSCIVTGQSLATPTGWKGVAQVAAEWRAGRQVHLMVDGVPAKVTLAVETWTPGYRIALADGRHVELTGSHALPSGDDKRGHTAGLDWVQVGVRYVHCRALSRPVAGVTKGLPVVLTPDGPMALQGDKLIERPAEHTRVDRGHGFTYGGPDEQTYSERFRPVAAGDEIDGSTVTKVTPMGRCAAYRIATDRFGWLSLRTDAGPIRVGQRHHEIGGWLMEQDGVVYSTPYIWSTSDEVYDLVERAEELVPFHLLPRFTETPAIWAEVLRAKAARVVRDPVKEWGERRLRAVRRPTQNVDCCPVVEVYIRQAA